jgi:DNA helicase-2/ATP-dependent DNA helicase PcrA
MPFESCPDRDRVLSCEGHALVLGGPGCGKTTLALHRASRRIQAGLEPGQKVLFLSFSRAAVARIVQGAREELPFSIQSHLQIETFHSFCWQIVRGHGYLLGAPSPIRLLAPHDERALRNGAKGDDPEWNAERNRLFHSQGLLAFDLFALKAVELLKGSASIRTLIAQRHPLIIVDEAQDTDTDQWECVRLLADQVQLLCLADLDQQIYEFRGNVSPDRLNQIAAALSPLQVDLAGDNRRSPSVEVVQFGNDVLRGTPRGAPYSGVSHFLLPPAAAERDKCLRAAVGILTKRIADITGRPPTSLAYLTAWGRGVTIIARALQGGDSRKVIPHRVVMDEAVVFLATRVVALCLEPIADRWVTLAKGLDLLADLYRARGGATNAKKATQLVRNAADARIRQFKGGAKCPRVFDRVLSQLSAGVLRGEPGADWVAVRRLLADSGAEELKLVAQLVVYLMAFNRGQRISESLADIWQRRGRYEQARELVENAIAEDQIVGGNGDLRGLNVMTMHKSKGKEFDGVILVHLGNSMSPFSPASEPPPHAKSRRLLRVAITRARHHVLLLTDASSPSPLLSGHRLRP